MFHLTKILNGRIGVPEPERIRLSTSVSVRYGMPVILKSGTLTKLTSSSTEAPTHLILADSEGDEVLASLITEEMLFEVPVSAAPDDMTEGTEYLVSTDSLSITAVAASSDKRGAVLCQKNGAKAAGDKVTVAFKH